MKYHHIIIDSLTTVVDLMLVINHLGLRPAWLIPTHQNTKLLLVSRYTIVTHI